jgi:hypothetical protein
MNICYTIVVATFMPGLGQGKHTIEWFYCKEQMKSQNCHSEYHDNDYWSPANTFVQCKFCPQYDLSTYHVLCK